MINGFIKKKNMLIPSLKELLKDQKLAIFNGEIKQGLPSTIKSCLFQISIFPINELRIIIFNNYAWNNWQNKQTLKY